MFESLKRRVLNRLAYYTSLIKLQKILKRVDSSFLFVDCGANVGDISELFLKRGAIVKAFEPDLLAYKHLQKRFAGADRIEIINKAVAVEDGHAMFYYHKERLNREGIEFTVSSSLLGEKINVDQMHGVEVETVNLCRYIENLGRAIDVLKMDIEGEEIVLLNQMIEDETYKKAKLILVETHETKIPGHTEKVAALKKLILDKRIENIKLNWI
jgi:FkbM family methyltransferase